MEIIRFSKEITTYPRREWIKKMALFGIVLSAVPSNLFAIGKKKKNHWLIATVSNKNNNPLPINKSIPFDWNYAEIPSDGEGLKLTWSINEKDLVVKNLYLRISSATDIREDVSISVVLAKSRMLIAKFKMDFAHYFQPFQILIQPEYQHQVFSEGVFLTKTIGEKPLWILIGNDNKTPTILSPHLFLSNSFKEHNQWKKDYCY